MRPSAARAVAGALALVLAVAACGGASPTPSATPTPAATSPSPTSTPVVEPTSTAPATPSPAADTPSPAADTPSPTPTASLDAGAAATLQTAIDALRAKGNFPGISAAVVFPDGSIWTGQSGVTVLSTGAALTEDTIFSVGSISKTFTAALALRLAEQGAIGLDDRVSRWVPTFPNAANITLRQLLNHTSGIRDFFEPAIYKYIGADHNKTWTPEEVLARVGKPYFAPGKGYHYSSSNYLLLGMALERATGKTLAELMHTELLDPLGLGHTFLQSEDKATGTLAHGYLGPPSAPKDVSVGQAMLPYVSVATAAGASGGFASTAADIARWGAALYSGQVLDAASLADMTNLAATRPYHPTFAYGLGVEQLPVAGRLAWGHRGHRRRLLVDGGVSARLALHVRGAHQRRLAGPATDCRSDRDGIARTGVAGARAARRRRVRGPPAPRPGRRNRLASTAKGPGLRVGASPSALALRPAVTRDGR